MSCPRILVVEDQIDVRNVVGEVLAEGGYDVDAVGSSEAALEALARRPYDLVISDLRLPGLSGQTLVKELVRRWPGLAERIILLTGDAAEARGPLPVIRKPFTLEEILGAVEARLSAA